MIFVFSLEEAFHTEAFRATRKTKKSRKLTWMGDASLGA